MNYTELIQQNLNELRKKDLPLSYRNNCYKNLGYYFHEIGQPSKSIEYYQKINPKDFITLRSLAAIYLNINQSQAIFYTYKCLEKQFDINVAYDLAVNLTKNIMFDRALSLYDSIILLDPKYVNAYNNVASILCGIMEQKKALEYYEKAYELDPTRMDIYSNIVMTTYYIPRFSHHKRYEYAQRFDKLLNVTETLCEDRKIDKDNIRIGYLGYDFDKSEHPISCFVNHIFENHSSNFQVYCYQISDKVSSVFQSNKKSELYTKNMKNVITKELSDKTDYESAKVIHDDKIDILIELTHHTAGNRLKILSYKPALIQISYVAFPGTTGMKKIDYKILDKEVYNKKIQNFTTEKILCMPNGFHCFKPMYEFPKITYTPHQTINLCCFNNTKKMNDDVIETWIHILRLIPKAVLYLRYFQYSSNYIITLYKQAFLRISKKMYYNIDMSRIIFIGYQENYVDTLKLFNNMDIFLDTFPYNGTTVLCEALTMGVPIITMKGKGVQERMGASLLASLGKKEWIATTKQEYIDKVVELSREKLAIYKMVLPKLVKESIIGDDKLFIKEYEETLLSAIGS